MRRILIQKLAKPKNFFLRMMKNRQHQHKGNPHTQKKSQDAATSVDDAITPKVHTSGIKTSCVCMYLKNLRRSVPTISVEDAIIIIRDLNLCGAHCRRSSGAVGS
jgi:hypothetical protein